MSVTMSKHQTAHMSPVGGASSSSQLLHLILGSPVVSGCVEAAGRCYVCAATLSRGKMVSDWLGSNYTDQNRVRSPHAAHVCEACVMLAQRKFPVPGRPPKEDKQFGGNFRNYSHMVEVGWLSPPLPDGTQVLGYANASKAEKPLIRGFLGREHAGIWFAAIADSGQKHVVSFAPLNGPGRGGRVLFEEMVVDVPESLALVDEMAALLTGGAIKDEVESGDYRPQTWLRCRDTLHAFEEEHRSERGSGWFSLAVWLAQRDEEATEARLMAESEEKRVKAQRAPRAPKKGQNSGRAQAKRATKATRDSVGGDADSVPGSVHKALQWARNDGVLGADGKPVSECREDDYHRKPVGNQGPRGTPNRGSGQLAIPGIG
jgi:hypothetical protein